MKIQPAKTDTTVQSIALKGNSEGEVVEAFEAQSLLTSSVSLPPTLYSACILILGAYHGAGKNEYWQVWASLVLFLELLASHFCQGYLTYIMYDIQVKKTCYFNVDKVGRTIVLALFSAAILVDLRETLNMILWTWHIKTSSDHEALQVHILNRGKKTERKTIVSGITKLSKICFWVIIFIPKLAIALSLLILCGAYLSKSENNENLILHCLAINFILYTDEILFHLFTPPFLKTVLSSLPPIETNTSSTRFKVLLWFVPLVNFACLAGISALLYYLGSCFPSQNGAGGI